MITSPSDATRRRFRAEATADWLGLAYRVLFYALVATTALGRGPGLRAHLAAHVALTVR